MKAEQQKAKGVVWVVSVWVSGTASASASASGVASAGDGA